MEAEIKKKGLTNKLDIKSEAAKTKYYPLAVHKPCKCQWRYSKDSKLIKRSVRLQEKIYVILRTITQKYRKLLATARHHEGKTIIDMLDKIIPSAYFGSNQNRKRFYYIVNKITTQSRGDCVFKSTLSTGYDLKCISWLEEFNFKKSEKRLLKTNLYLLNNIVKPLIMHFYVCVTSLKSYEIQFIPRRRWDIFQANIFKKLIQENHLVPADFKTYRGQLMLFPKNDLDSLEYRPVVYALKISSKQKIEYKQLSFMLYTLAKQFSTLSAIKTDEFWKNFSFPEEEILYGIKVDVKDAYGNVNINKICQVINESYLQQTVKQFLINHIENQYVSYKKRTYKWEHGLLQGDHLSAALCNLYLCVLEQEHLQIFMKSGFRFHRIADDYLFCSTNRKEIVLFEYIFKQNFPVNESKIQRACIDYISEITYYGQVINFEKRQIGKSYDTNITHKFKFWNLDIYRNKIDIIKNTLRYSLTHHYFKYYTGMNENDCLLNYFKGMVYVAFKLDSVVRAVIDINEKSTDIPFFVRTVRETINKHAEKNCKYFKGKINFSLLKVIGTKAFILVMKKNLSFFKGVIDCLNVKINKSRENTNIDFIFNKIPYELSNIRVKRKSKI